MGMAKIYWDRENYPMVEKVFRQSAEFCSEHDVWKLNVAHVFFMQVGGARVVTCCAVVVCVWWGGGGEARAVSLTAPSLPFTLFVPMSPRLLASAGRSPSSWRVSGTMSPS